MPAPPETMIGSLAWGAMIWCGPAAATTPSRRSAATTRSGPAAATTASPRAQATTTSTVSWATIESISVPATIWQSAGREPICFAAAMATIPSMATASSMLCEASNWRFRPTRRGTTRFTPASSTMPISRRANRGPSICSSAAGATICSTAISATTRSMPALAPTESGDLPATTRFLPAQGMISSPPASAPIMWSAARAATPSTRATA